ncbi:MAG TPA: Clp protease N-terminal domain-containing protein, partial [Thermoanaerobaculia bacterium]|nr:Clp protease N-terminal domain-containing protein [Thermoanaerobaculia bacterium]
MSSLDLKSLIDKLSPLCRRTLEEAAGLCVSRTHYNVEIEHLLAKLLALPEGQDTDLRRALRQYGIDRSLLTAQVEEALGRFDTGNSRTPAFSPQILQLFREAWLATSLQLKSPAVRTGSLLLALLDHDLLRGVAVQSVPALGKIPRDHLRENARELFRGSVEDVGAAAKAPMASAPLKAAPSPAAEGAEGSDEPSATPALDQFTIDLTARARA